METIKKYKIPLLAFLTAILLKLFVFDIYQVNGDSMSPYLKSGDIILVEKLSYKFSNPKGDDVVVIKNDEIIVKRIAASEGDIIEYKDNNFYVNGVLKVSSIPIEGDKKDSIPPDYYYVLGDNKDLSLDSRSFGPVHRKSILGKYIFRIYTK